MKWIWLIEFVVSTLMKQVHLPWDTSAVLRSKEVEGAFGGKNETVKLLFKPRAWTQLPPEFMRSYIFGRQRRRRTTSSIHSVPVSLKKMGFVGNDVCFWPISMLGREKHQSGHEIPHAVPRRGDTSSRRSTDWVLIIQYKNLLASNDGI